jgi:branched-chain amino acid transport system ATP-binding protein/neutral amino acid transport system ATP-binding protein
MKYIQPILKLENLTKTFDGLHAVDHCSFAITPNTITGLIGPNGAGKTTTFDLITGTLEETSGKIYFKDEDITHLEAHKRARLGLARTFQIVRLFPELTALENLLIVLHKNYQNLSHIFFKPQGELKRLHDEAREYLKEINLEHHAGALAKNLSYGQQKLLEIMRSVATGAELFLLDEPAAGVNPTMLRHIEKIILYLKSRGKTVLIVEHNMPFIMGICDHVIVLDQGRHLVEGRPQDIQKNQLVLEAYLGRRRPTLL